jgi:hypothetical protein
MLTRTCLPIARIRLDTAIVHKGPLELLPTPIVRAVTRRRRTSFATEPRRWRTSSPRSAQNPTIKPPQMCELPMAVLSPLGSGSRRARTVCQSSSSAVPASISSTRR